MLIDNTVRTDTRNLTSGGLTLGISSPSLLLHVCCAPCATHAIHVLQPEYRTTLFFSNSNIAPRAEYDKRLAEAVRLAGITGCPLVEDAYDHDAWLEHIRGLEAEPEGGRRCERCFDFNLRRAARYAVDHEFDRFATTLTVSPHKRSRQIFEVGRPLERFLEIDLKKQDGFKRSVEWSRLYNLYRQSACGCEFSRHA